MADISEDTHFCPATVISLITETEPIKLLAGKVGSSKVIMKLANY